MSTRDRRAVMILGGVLVVGLAFFLLTRGGGKDEAAAPPPAPAPAPAPVATPTPEPERFRFLSGRNPFLPLVVTADQVGAAGGETSGATVIEPSNNAEGQAAGGATAKVGGKQVTLVDIFSQGGEKVAQIEVDGETNTVSEGEKFSGNFELVSIQGSCANLLHGDESFTLCLGGELK